jgi:hypothetical protein
MELHGEVFYVGLIMETRASKRQKVAEDDGFVLHRGDVAPREEVRCASQWERGVTVEEQDPKFRIFMKPPVNCTVAFNGSIAYIALPAEREWLDVYLESIKRLTAEELLEARDGVYTWMMYRTRGDATLKFAATRVQSVFELGTIHQAIAHSVGAVSVHGAGEMKKEGETLIYNFQSGSYVATWIKPKDRTCTLAEMEEFLVPKLMDLFPPRTLRRQRVDSTFITMEPTMEELQLYADAGFLVCIHPVGRTEECKAAKGTCANPLKSRYPR